MSAANIVAHEPEAFGVRHFSAKEMAYVSFRPSMLFPGPFATHVFQRTDQNPCQRLVMFAFHLLPLKLMSI
jgi:hypothetical protein